MSTAKQVTTQTSQNLYKHYLRAISLWPKDPLRPTLLFQDALRRRADKKFLPNSRSADTTANKSEASVTNTNTNMNAVDEAAESEQVNALYGLLEGRYQNRYPVNKKLFTPESNPTHYADLLRELDEAPTRPFWKRVSNQWKGLFRF